MARSDKSYRYSRARIIFLQDLMVSLLASLLAILLIRWISEPIPGFTLLVVKWLAAALVAMVAGLLLSSSYKDVRRFATVRSMAKTVMTVLVKEAGLSLVFITGLVRLPVSNALLVILVDAVLSGALLLYLRFSARLLLKHNTDIKSQAQRRSALVVGTSDASLAMAAELEKEGYSVVGLLTREPSQSGLVISDYVVYLYSSDADIARLQWQLGGVDCIFFPKTEEAFKDTAEAVQEEAPQRDGMSLAGHALKRCFDIGLSSLLLLIFSPLIAICAIMIKREDGGPVIFAQERIGRGGVPFNIYKFRSMRVDAESDGSPALYTGEDDPRLTRVGRFIRAHHLDELPQLWNVLRGDMSFIGYRPERKYYIDRIMACNARYRYLYQIRPGVTSYATLYNGYTDTLEKMLTRLDLDLYYLRNHSVWFDVKVLGLTFLSIVSGKKF